MIRWPDRKTWVVLACVAVVAAGCARAPRDTTGFTISETVTVDAGFDEAWLATRDALRDMGFDIYTRDKRGLFIAFSEPGRQWLVPHRTQHTVVLEPVDPARTSVEVDTINQVYGVTPLTYPDWHDRPADDNAEALQFLERLHARLGLGAPPEPAEAPPSVDPAEPTDAEPVGSPDVDATDAEPVNTTDAEPVE